MHSSLVRSDEDSKERKLSRSGLPGLFGGLLGLRRIVPALLFPHLGLAAGADVVLVLVLELRRVQAGALAVTPARADGASAKKRGAGRAVSGRGRGPSALAQGAP